MTTTVEPAPLAGVVVVEAAQRLVGPLAGLHLALLGATVIKVEPPDGDAARRWASGAVHRLLDVSKKPAGQLDLEATIKVVGEADAVILDAGSLADAVVADPALRAGLRSVVVIENDDVPGAHGCSETTVQGAAAFPAYLGEPHDRRLRLGADLASATAAVQVVQATLLGLGSEGNPGQVCRVSPFRSLLTTKSLQLASRSDPAGWVGYHVLAGERPPDQGHAAADGHISIEFPPDQRDGWRRFCLELGLEGIADDPQWYITLGLGSRVDEMRPIYEQAFARWRRDELVDLVRSCGGWAVPFLTPTEAIEREQTRLWGAVYREGDDVTLCSPWQLEGVERVELRPFGDHAGTEVRPNVAGSGRTGGSGSARAVAGREHSDSRGRTLPLSGLKVVDLGIGGVGPWAAAQLAQLGATVVKVEAPNEFILSVRPDWRVGTTSYRALNVGKASLTLDLKSEVGRGAAWELIESADVLIENFRAGAMERLGFGLDAVRSRNAAIVYCTTNGYGSSGPMAGLPCTDPHMQAFSGYAALNGRPDALAGQRMRYYGAVDLFTSNVVVEGVLAALLRRDATGEGQRVEVSMLAAATTACISRLAEELAGSGPTGRAGSRGGHVHPDGFYQTKDAAIALTVEDDAAFERFCAVIGRTELTDRPEFATAGGRRRYADRLDEEIHAALSTASADWWLVALRRAGIVSGRVHAEHELLAHRDAWSAGHLRVLPDPGRGVDEMVIAGPGLRFDGIADEEPWAPEPGEHTEVIMDSTHRWRTIEEVVARRRGRNGR